MEEKTGTEEGIVFDAEDFALATDEGGDEAAEETPETEKEKGEEGAVKPAAADEPEEGEEDAREDNPPEKEAQELEVKYNGETKKLSKEEAVEYAQKGMNYDKLHERLKGYEEEHSLLEALAKSAGKPVKDMISELKGRMEEAEILKRAEELLADGVPKEKAEAIAKKQIERERTLRTDNVELETLRADALRSKARDKALETWQRFVEEHPEIKSYEELDESVKAAVREGKELEDAYNAWELRKLKDENAKAAKAQENKKKAPPSAKDREGSDETESDPFLRGFLGKRQ